MARGQGHRFGRGRAGASGDVGRPAHGHAVQDERAREADDGAPCVERLGRHPAHADCAAGRVVPAEGARERRRRSRLRQLGTRRRRE